MGSKLQSRVTSLFSAIAALFLLLAGLFELNRGETGMAIMAAMGMICACIIAWHTRKPYERKISYLPNRARNN
ncbi:MAG: hypothetical protein HKO64_00270 [Xanthomonadales bacterium]|nr:hypothetical protein [Gammaproteobacteria bacterium]NNE04714.1 hypothetical protein [Xanthomonadales bacterium]NNL94029.1 hypothetical protein [Xanthomonadales bacterium]